MTIRVALNGFGRIGRNIFRVLYDRDDIEVAAICDPAPLEKLVYLLKYDSLTGPFRAYIEQVNGQLCAKGRLIPFVEGRRPGEADWRQHDVDIVIEASGRYRRRSELEAHLDRGARRVILTVPPSDELDATVFQGINDDQLDATCKIVSAGSLATNAVAPILKILDDAFGVQEAFYNLVHAYTNDLSLADVSNNPSDLSVDDAPDDDLRRSRSAAMNILPASTRSPIDLDGLFPHLTGRIGGMAMSAAVPDGSVVDLLTFHDRRLSTDELNAVMRSAASTRFAGVVQFCDEPIVSSDVAGNPHSAIFDSLMCSVISDDSGGRRSMVKTLTWYDNGLSYAHRIVSLISKMSATF